MMKIIYISLSLLLSISNISYAKGNSTLAFKILQKHFRGHLLPSDKECPKDSDVEFHYLDRIQSKTKLSNDISAYVLRTESCPGWGVDEAQYLIITENDSGFVAHGLDMGYYSFMVDKIRTNGDLIILDGSRHIADTCHACSVKARIVYNYKTKKIIKQ